MLNIVQFLSSSAPWLLQFKKQEAEADVVVGADGVSSPVRSLIGFPIKKSSRGEYTYFSGVVNSGLECAPFETLGPGMMLCADV